MGPVLLSHESILSLPRLGLSPVLPSSKVPSFITPSQDMFLYCNDSVHQVGLSHATMVCGWMMFSKVITRVNVSCFPFYFEVILLHLITDPIKAHVFGYYYYYYYCSSHDAICRGIVCDDFSGLLWVSHLSQGCSKCLEFFGILE